MVALAIVQKRVSDITGTEAPEESFSKLIVRQHPAADHAKRLDVLPDEMSTLKEVGDLVIIEVTAPDGSTREMFVRYTDFSKVVSDDIIKQAASLRGRQPGSRNGNGV